MLIAVEHAPWQTRSASPALTSPWVLDLAHAVSRRTASGELAPSIALPCQSGSKSSALCVLPHSAR
jgi:hypothetical protein